MLFEVNASNFWAPVQNESANCESVKTCTSSCSFFFKIKVITIGFALSLKANMGTRERLEPRPGKESGVFLFAPVSQSERVFIGLSVYADHHVCRFSVFLFAFLLLKCILRDSLFHMSRFL